MGPRTALPWTVLLLFFLHLLPAGGRSLPLLRPDQVPDRLGIQELLHGLGDKISETQAEQKTPEPLQQGRDPKETEKAGEAAPKSSNLQAFRGLQMPKVMQSSGCFGRTRMDRIDSVSGLGCKVLRRP